MAIKLVFVCLFQTKSYLRKNAISEVNDLRKNASLSETKVGDCNQSNQHYLTTDTSSCSNSLEGPDYIRDNSDSGAWTSSSKTASRLSNSLFTPVTLFVNSQTSLSDVVTEQYRGSSADSLMLTGLHTCGNLSADILRLYVTTPSAHILCQLGCCYNLLSERFLHFPGIPGHSNIITLDLIFCVKVFVRIVHWFTYPLEYVGHSVDLLVWHGFVYLISAVIWSWVWGC